MNGKMETYKKRKKKRPYIVFYFQFIVKLLLLI